MEDMVKIHGVESGLHCSNELKTVSFTRRETAQRGESHNVAVFLYKMSRGIINLDITSSLSIRLSVKRHKLGRELSKNA